MLLCRRGTYGVAAQVSGMKKQLLKCTTVVDHHDELNTQLNTDELNVQLITMVNLVCSISCDKETNPDLIVGYFKGSRVSLYFVKDSCLSPRSSHPLCSQTHIRSCGDLGSETRTDLKNSWDTSFLQTEGAFLKQALKVSGKWLVPSL